MDKKEDSKILICLNFEPIAENGESKSTLSSNSRRGKV